MRKGFLFFAFSCSILVLSIINLSIGPVVSKVVGKTQIINGNNEPALDWGTPYCERLKDIKDKRRIFHIMHSFKSFTSIYCWLNIFLLIIVV